MILDVFDGNQCYIYGKEIEMKNRIFQDLMDIKEPTKLGRFFLLSFFLHCLMIYGLLMVPFVPVTFVKRDSGIERGFESSAMLFSESSPSDFYEEENSSPPPEWEEPEKVNPGNFTGPMADGNINIDKPLSDSPGTTAPKVINARSTGSTSPVVSYSHAYRPLRRDMDIVDTDEYIRLYRKPFRFVLEKPRSSFSLKIHTLSYPRVRRAIKKRQLPAAEEIKIEELINYFQYDYPQPTGEFPISITTELAACPWNPSNRLLHIGLQAKVLFGDAIKNSRFVVAKDVNIQVIFNPNKVAAYRLIGYGSRTPKVGQWSDEFRGSGAIRAAQKITSLYELIPAPPAPGTKNENSETGTVMISYREPKKEGEVGWSKVHWISRPIAEMAGTNQEPSANFRFSAVVAQFGMILKNSETKNTSSMTQLLEWAKDAVGEDRYGYRAEFIKLLETYRSMLEAKRGY